MLRKLVPDVISAPRVVSLTEEATVLEAAQVMRDQNIGAVLVMSGPYLRGIFSERDMVNRVVADCRDPRSTELVDVMTRDPDCVEANDTAMTALRMMDDGGYRHLPVMQRGRVIGVVSRRDFTGVEMAQLDDEEALWSRIG